MAPPKTQFFLQRRDREKRKRLIVLVRCLTKMLDLQNRIVLLHRVKCVVREYADRLRLGDTTIAPLHDTIESRLHALVDNETWTRVILCLELYMAQRHNRKQPPPPASTSRQRFPTRRVLTGNQVPV